MKHKSGHICNARSVPLAIHRCVVWWPGRLRSFESFTSFAVSFCSLNGISFKQFNNFLENITSINGDEGDLPAKIAHLIDEDVTTVMGMIDGLEALGDIYSYSLHGHEGWFNQIFQYCPACVRFGYHSNFHSLLWLTHCPFHLTPLLKTHMDKSEFDTLFNLFQDNCTDWPVCDQSDYSLYSSDKNVLARLLLAWIGNAYSEVKKLSQNQIWEQLEYEPLKPEHLNFSFGRICRVEKLPDILNSIVIRYEKWSLKTVIFSVETSREISEILAVLTMDVIYKMYKIISAHDEGSATFLKKSGEYCRRAHALHMPPCNWHKMDCGWGTSIWLEVENLTCLLCPNKVVRDGLERGWGKSELLIPTRSFLDHVDWFRWAITILEELDQARVKNNQSSSPNPLAKDFFSAYEWRNKSSSVLLNSMANYELDCYFKRASSWLDSIKNGGPPHVVPEIFGSIRLVNSDGKMKLLKWQTI